MDKKLTTANGRSDRNAMQLFPGEVGLRGDRATFHLGGRNVPTATDQPAPSNEAGRPSGAVYYNMRPPVMVTAPSKKNQSVVQPQLQQRKHVMQVLPSLPVTTEPIVGSVTGLPVGENEHVFVMRVGKRHDEPDEKARLQIEVRMLKQDKPARTNADTQFSEVDVHTTTNNATAADKMTKKNKKKKAGKKGKK